MTERHRSILVVAPWLEGGGGQAALVGIMRELPTPRVHLVVLFSGNRHHEPAIAAAGRVTFLDQPRNAWGAVRASRALSPLLVEASHVYSLMRASHIVLGLTRVNRLRRQAFAASFHQLPSEDSRSFKGRVENILLRRAVRRAQIVTAPSERAVREIISYRFAPARIVRYEPNIVPVPKSAPIAARPGVLTEVRLTFVGRLSAQKGLDRFPELLAATTVPVVVRIVGDGEEAALVRELAARIGPQHRIEVIGHSDNPHEHLSWGDALVLPSRWELNPIVVWEAWSLGRAVLASRLTVFEDLGTVGPVHLFADSAEFATEIERIAASNDQRRDDYTRAITAFRALTAEGQHLARFLST